MSNKKREFVAKKLADIAGASLIEVVASETFGMADDPKVQWTTLFTAWPNKNGTGFYTKVPKSISIQPGAELNLFIKGETNVK